MSPLSYELLVKAAHRHRNHEIRKLILRLLVLFTNRPARLRTSRWIAAHRGW